MTDSPLNPTALEPIVRQWIETQNRCKFADDDWALTWELTWSKSEFLERLKTAISAYLSALPKPPDSEGLVKALRATGLAVSANAADTIEALQAQLAEAKDAHELEMGRCQEWWRSKVQTIRAETKEECRAAIKTAVAGLMGAVAHLPATDHAFTSVLRIVGQLDRALPDPAKPDGGTV